MISVPAERNVARSKGVSEPRLPRQARIAKVASNHVITRPDMMRAIRGAPTEALAIIPFDPADPVRNVVARS